MSVNTRMTLLQRIRASDDHEAWEEFYSLYFPVLDNFFRYSGVQSEDAADISQEVLKRIARAAPDFQYNPSKGRFRNWLYRIAQNEMNRYLARSLKRKGREIPMDTLPEKGGENELEMIWDREYRSRAFSWAAERVRPEFSETAWSAFEKTVLEEVSPAEVAEGLGIQVGSVYIAKSRIVARLRECISSVNGETESFDE